jgi:hypothetical protein
MMPALVLAVIWWPQGLNAAEHAIGQCAGNYVGCLEDWKQQRLNFLQGADGYLNLAGLYWLKEGDNTFGSSSSSDFIFPDRAGAELGTFNLENGQVTMVVNTRNDVRVGERRVSRIIMRDDTATSPTIASHGSLQWIVIRRDEQFAVRVRDFSHPALENFAPIESYPADEAFRVTATLHPYPERRIVRVDTVIAGLDYNPWAPGVARFELDGQAYELEAYDAGPELFFVFGDLTSGRETYPAGRFLYAAKPGDDGVFTLDFNTAHNPPCAFNEFATCPVASPRNRLPVRIPAGEKFDPATH